MGYITWEFSGMIKKLLFMIALLAPGLAYGVDPSADLSVRIVPPGSPPAVPAPAAAAGFTNPVVQADFTTGSGFWSTPANYIVECGAAASTPQVPATWHFHVGLTFGGGLPCARANIVSDGGLSALQVKVLRGDPGDGSHGRGGLIFPALWGEQNGNSNWMPNAYYIRLTFRFDSQTLTQGGPGAYGDDEFWSTGGSYPGVTTWVDLNVGETQNDNVGNLVRFAGGYWEWQSGGCQGPPFICNLFGTHDPPRFDMTQYHTIEMLWTSDGSSIAASCEWLDANGNYNGPGFLGCGSGSYVNGSNYSEHSRIYYLDMGKVGGVITSDATVWVR